MSTYCYIFVIFCIKYYFAFKIGTYNTAQTLNGGFQNNAETLQINELESLENDIDVMCVQELFYPVQAKRYRDELQSSYQYSFSGVDSFDFTEKVPCSAEQLTLLQHPCIQTCAGATWPNQGAFAYCMAQSCKDQFFSLIYSGCLNCIAVCMVSPLCNDNYETAMAFCGPPTILPPFDWIDGTMILSKHEIINSWSFDIPSWYSQRAISIAEIDVCSVTNSNVADDDSDDSDDSDDNGICHDTIIVGCVHLKDTDHDLTDPVNTFFPVSQDQIDLGISSFVQLNGYQSNYILENVLNRDAAPWIHDGDDNNNVVAIFIAGDFNVGKLLYPQNLAIWEKARFILGRDIDGLTHIDNRGTYNADPNSELPNKLANEFCTQNSCLIQDSDLDHVLVKTKKKHHRRHSVDGDNQYNVGGIKGISYNRMFTDLFNVNQDGNMIPLSDHWGVNFEFVFKKKND